MASCNPIQVYRRFGGVYPRLTWSHIPEGSTFHTAVRSSIKRNLIFIFVKENEIGRLRIFVRKREIKIQRERRTSCVYNGEKEYVEIYYDI
jgi:hypothetical protein